MRRDWAEGSGPAVELANPGLLASPDVAVVEPGAAVDVVAGVAVLVPVGPLAVPVGVEVGAEVVVPLLNNENAEFDGAAVPVVAVDGGPEDELGLVKREEVPGVDVVVPVVAPGV